MQRLKSCRSECWIEIGRVLRCFGLNWSWHALAPLGGEKRRLREGNSSAIAEEVREQNRIAAMRRGMRCNCHSIGEEGTSLYARWVEEIVVVCR